MPPVEVVRHLAELVARREMHDAAGELLHGVTQGKFLVQDGVRDDAVALRRLEELGELVFRLGNDGEGVFLAVGIDLGHALRTGPLVPLVHHPGRLVLGVDVQDEDVPVHLEHVVESCPEGRSPG